MQALLIYIYIMEAIPRYNMDAIEHATQGPHIINEREVTTNGEECHQNKREILRHRQILLSDVYRCVFSDGSVREARAVGEFSVLFRC